MRLDSWVWQGRVEGWLIRRWHGDRHPTWVFQAVTTIALTGDPEIAATALHHHVGFIFVHSAPGEVLDRDAGYGEQQEAAQGDKRREDELASGGRGRHETT